MLEHRRIRQQTLGVHLEGGQRDVGGEVADGGGVIERNFLVGAHLQVEQHRADVVEGQVAGPRRRVAAGPDTSGRHSQFEVLRGVFHHVLEEGFAETSARLETPHDVRDERGVLLDVGESLHGSRRSGRRDGLRLLFPDDPQNVLVAFGAQTVLRTEMMDDQAG